MTVVELTMTQAALGAAIDVPTLDGSASLEFKPGTQPGEVRLLKGQGCRTSAPAGAAASGCS